MHDGHGGDHHGGAHGAGFDHSGGGAFGHGAGAFGHSFDLGHMAADLGSHGFEHSAAPSSGHGHAHGHSAGHAPGAVTGHSGWAFGYIGHALAQAGVLDVAASTKSCSGQEVRLPGIVVRGETIQLLVWPHGQTNTQQLFRRIATRHGLLNLSRRARGIVASSKENATLLDTKQFDGPGHNSRASGSFPGASGATTVWNEFWQAPSKKHWWQSASLQIGPPLHCHIVVTGYTWFFEQTGDFETRIAITVTNPKTTEAGEWVPIDEEAVRRHTALARKIAADLYAELRKVQPQEYSKVMRQIQAASAQIEATAPVKEPEPAPLAAASRARKVPGLALHAVAPRGLISFEMGGQ